jgi:hypothetical protein
MILNFRAREISRGTRKLTRTTMLIKKNINIECYLVFRVRKKNPESKSIVMFFFLFFIFMFFLILYFYK